MWHLKSVMLSETFAVLMSLVHCISAQQPPGTANAPGSEPGCSDHKFDECSALVRPFLSDGTSSTAKPKITASTVIRLATGPLDIAEEFCNTMYRYLDCTKSINSTSNCQNDNTEFRLTLAALNLLCDHATVTAIRQTTECIRADETLIELQECDEMARSTTEVFGCDLVEAYVQCSQQALVAPACEANKATLEAAGSHIVNISATLMAAHQNVRNCKYTALASSDPGSILSQHEKSRNAGLKENLVESTFPNNASKTTAALPLQRTNSGVASNVTTARDSLAVLDNKTYPTSASSATNVTASSPIANGFTNSTTSKEMFRLTTTNASHQQFTFPSPGSPRSTLIPQSENTTKPSTAFQLDSSQVTTTTGSPQNFSAPKLQIFSVASQASMIYPTSTTATLASSTKEASFKTQNLTSSTSLHETSSTSQSTTTSWTVSTKTTAAEATTTDAPLISYINGGCPSKLYYRVASAIASDVDFSPYRTESATKASDCAAQCYADSWCLSALFNGTVQECGLSISGSSICPLTHTSGSSDIAYITCIACSDSPSAVNKL